MPTHGSLTETGKVRNQTPKNAAQFKKKPSPKSRNRRDYMKRFVKKRYEKDFRSSYS